MPNFNLVASKDDFSKRSNESLMDECMKLAEEQKDLEEKVKQLQEIKARRVSIASVLFQRACDQVPYPFDLKQLTKPNPTWTPGGIGQVLTSN